jgi:transcriptional regulator with XRE-family HTH domain
VGDAIKFNWEMVPTAGGDAVGRHSMAATVPRRNSLEGMASPPPMRYTRPVTADSARSELGSALRGSRERRRVSQLELALDAGTTQRHVSYIENARSLPGRAMVLRLAEALQIPLRDRNTLLLAGGYAPAYGETSLDDSELGPVRSAVERIPDGHRPYPGVAAARHGELVSANAAFWALIHGTAPELLEPPVNVPRVLLHPNGVVPRILNFDVWAWHVIEALKRESVRNPSERLDSLIAELESLAPDRPRPQGPEYLGFSVPLRLRAGGAELELITTLTYFGTAVDVAVAELRLEAFLPADDATATALAKLTGTAG